MTLQSFRSVATLFSLGSKGGFLPPMAIRRALYTGFGCQHSRVAAFAVKLRDNASTRDAYRQHGPIQADAPLFLD